MQQSVPSHHLQVTKIMHTGNEIECGKYVVAHVEFQIMSRPMPIKGFVTSYEKCIYGYIYCTLEGRENW